MFEPYLVLAILMGTLVLFIWGVWRYDVVAFLALMVSLLVGVVPFQAAFSGFSNPAVVTVLSVMVMSQAVSESRLIDYVIKKISLMTQHTTLHIAALSFLTALLSAFMNNVGALALMMPIAIRSAAKNKRSSSLVLMPIAFASLLGGLITVIGTPANILITEFRQQELGVAFNVFDFAPVGIVLAVVGVLFIALFGWRLLPKRKAEKSLNDLYQVQDYITELKIPADSPAVDKTVRDVERMGQEVVEIVGMIRGSRRRFTIAPSEILQANDILIVEASHDDLQKFLQVGKFELVTGEIVSPELLRSDEIQLLEAVVPRGARIEGRSAQRARLRARYRINLLAIAREGRPYKERLNHIKLRAGDVVLLQGDAMSLQEDAASLGFLPLIERGVSVGMRKQHVLPFIIFIGAILLAAFRVLPIQIAFAAGVLAMVLFRVMPIRKVYESINWSVIVLLGALIPIGRALETSGGSALLAHAFVGYLGTSAPMVVLGVLLLVTMLLSDVMNNAATAVIMAPIAMTTAQALHLNIDPFLMTVAIGASSSFLTPIGHQNNTIVMGPGGYRFCDYLRLGLPLELLIIAVALPTVLWVWPV